MFGAPCSTCGRFISFADDSTIIYRCSKGEDANLSIKIDNKLVKVEEFLAANNLKLNISNTQILRTVNGQQHVGNKQENIILEAQNDKGENIKPTNTAKILSITFNKSLIWRDYLETGKEVMVTNLKRKLSALKHVSKFSSYNTRVKLANGCIMSKIIYSIQVWGLYCRPSSLKKVQSVQYNTLKWVTGRYCDSLKVLLNTTGWMSVYQPAIYHSLVLCWKVITYKKLERLTRRIIKSMDSIARLQLTERTWSQSSERYYRLIEGELSGATKISEVKSILRRWIKTNIPICEE